MQQLTIDWHALEMAFDDHPDEFGVDRTNYFDVESGEVVFVDEEISSTVNGVQSKKSADLQLVTVVELGRSRLASI